MLSNQLRYTFIALSRERRFLALSICYLVIKVFILVIFISRFGIWGACYGAVLAELVLVIMVRIGTGALDIPLRFPQRGVVATIVAALGMVLVWWAADTNWLLMVLGVSFGLLAAHVVNRLARSVRGPRGDRPDG
jgi:O-antigen/teichoic acid export membrane protein